ncbi:MAG: hypothetical protein B0D85_03130, partial [Candidatus Sedimenticola endophacoides]
MKQKKILALILSAGLSLSALAGETHIESEFRLAAGVDDVETMSRLLDQGVAVDSPNSIGKTALMMAIENDNMAATVLLLNRGADVNLATKAGCT